MIYFLTRKGFDKITAREVDTANQENSVFCAESGILLPMIRTLLENVFEEFNQDIWVDFSFLEIMFIKYFILALVDFGISF